MLDYESDVENWLKKMNWKENPFTLRIRPSLFVGYREEIRKIALHLREGHKVAMVTGSTGSGKTTFLRFIEQRVKDEYKVIYISKPPKKEDLLEIFLDNFKPTIWERIFGRNVRLHDLHAYLSKRLKAKKLLVLLDEVHEANIGTLEWLRTLCDQVGEMQLILAGLPTIDEILRKNLETLRSRVVTKIDLITLNREYTRELIRRRVESVEGKDIIPFTEGLVDEIYKKTGGFPREVLKLCNTLVQNAIEEGKFTIDSLPKSETGPVTEEGTSETGVRQEESEEEEKSVEVDKDFMRDLTYKQRKIVEILQDEEELYPSQIVEKLGYEKYKSKQHAVRSINNILNRLREADVVEREPKGKGYLYFLNVKARTFLAKK